VRVARFESTSVSLENVADFQISTLIWDLIIVPVCLFATNNGTGLGWCHLNGDGLSIKHRCRSVPDAWATTTHSCLSALIYLGKLNQGGRSYASTAFSLWTGSFACCQASKPPTTLVTFEKPARCSRLHAIMLRYPLLQ